jgi:hypothetical protein
MALLTAASLGLWHRYVAHIPSVALVSAAVALGVLAVGIVLAGLLGRRCGGLAAVAILLAIAVVNVATLRGSPGYDDNRVWAPVTASQLPGRYELGVGQARLDLTSGALAAGVSAGNPVDVTAKVGVGRLVVVVPRGTVMQIEAKVGIGSVNDDVSGTGSHGGAGNDVRITTGEGSPLFVVHTEVGIGTIEVVGPGTEVTR